MAGEDVLSPKLLSTLSVRSSVSNSHVVKLRTSPGCGPKPTGKLLPPPAALGSLFGPTARTHEPALKMLVPVVRRSAAPGTCKSKTVEFLVFLLSEVDPQPFVWAAPLGPLGPGLRVCVWPVGGPLHLPVQLNHASIPAHSVDGAHMDSTTDKLGKEDVPCTVPCRRSSLCAPLKPCS